MHGNLKGSEQESCADDSFICDSAKTPDFGCLGIFAFLYLLGLFYSLPSE